jgi:protein disulfide-isomerase A6
MKPLVGLLLLAATSYALYTSSDDVIELNASNFNKLVLQGDEVWIVEFFAPWCGHCQQLVPEYKKAATALKGVVKVGAVNADEHRSIGGQYGVQGFPTIKIFGSNKNKPEDYNGQRNAQGLVDAGLSAARSAVNARLSGRGGSKSGGGGGGGGSGGGNTQGDPKDVVELNDNNFDSVVLDSEDMWLVEFYAPWCGHCKNLAPHWASAATELKGKVKLGAVDATVSTLLANRYGVRGYPTIKYFGPGRKDADSAEEFNGGRTSGDIVNWALEKLAENVPAPEVLELVHQDVLSASCDDHQLCVIAFLPYILDCQSDCRNNYLSILKKLADKYKKRMWGWVWAEAGSQPEVEDSLGIGGFGYPAMAAVNARKMKFAVLRGSFDETGINEFLRELAVGRGSTAPVRNAQLPKVQTNPEWDGKDGELPPEEDIDLSDVELDELDKTEL